MLLEGDRPRNIDETLAVAREVLEMDMAFVAEFEDGEHVIRAVEGDAGSFQIDKGARATLGDTYCWRMVRGSLPHIVSDARADPRVRDLDNTAESDIGAYIGVPLQLADGSVRGSLCCLSHSPEERLGESDVRLLRLLARLAADDLERAARWTASRELEAEEHRLELASTGVGALLVALEARDSYTGEHSKAVVEVVAAVAREIGMPEPEVADARRVAVLHDIGKIGIPDAVLGKRGPLDPDETEMMRRHPAIGADIVKSVKSLAHLAPAVRAEHERWDGFGYPDGLAGEEIPLTSRIVFACDAFHAMRSDRPYRRALPEEEAIAELERGAGSQFCPRTVEALLAVLDRRARGRGRRRAMAHQVAGFAPLRKRAR